MVLRFQISDCFMEKIIDTISSELRNLYLNQISPLRPFGTLVEMTRGLFYKAISDSRFGGNWNGNC